MSQSSSSESEWFRRAFEKEYLDLYDHRTDEAAESEVMAIRTWVAARGLLAESSIPVVLDLGCGNGRHARAWSTSGAQILGVDLSADLIQVARDRKLTNTLFIEGDMRELAFHDLFDVATSLFTSFGYFSSEEEDQRVLDGIARALKPRGVFVFDFLNATHVRQSLVPETKETRKGVAVHHRRWISDDGLRVNKHTTMRRSDGTIREQEESVRLYSEDELREKLSRAGFVVEDAFGDFDGQSVLEDSPRVILISTWQGKEG